MPGGPSSSLHKGAVQFHPDGKHIILQVEMDEHPFKEALGGPGAGWFNNVWMTTSDGKRWSQLTNYPSGPDDRYGVLLPHISPDGKKVTWSQLYRGPQPKVSWLYKKGKLIPNTNPWGVTFDKWGHHVASHPVFASTFHATNPAYPVQHPRPAGVQAYSGVCGHDFVDFPFWPKDMQGGFIKVRYKVWSKYYYRWIYKYKYVKKPYRVCDWY